MKKNLIGKKNIWKKIFEKKLFEKKLFEKKIYLKINLLKKKLKTENINSFFEFMFFPQIRKLRQPFINQKNYQTSFYDSF